MEPESAQSQAEIRELNRSLIALQSAASAIALSLNVEHVLETFAWELHHLVKARNIQILRLAPGGETLRHTQNDLFPCIHDLATSGEIALKDFPLLARTVRERFSRQVTRETGQESPEQQLLQRCELEALLVVPIIFQDQTLGLVLAGAGREKGRFNNQELAFAQLLTNQAAASLTNAQLYEQSRQRLREQSVLRTAGARISSTLDRKAVLRHLAEQLSMAVAAGATRISTVEPKSWRTAILTVHRERNVPAAPPELAAILAAGLIEETSFLQRGEPATWRVPAGPLAGHMVLGIPLVLAERAVAFAEVWDGDRRRSFAVGDVELLQTIAQQGAVALEHARVHAELQQNLRELGTLNQVTQLISSTLELPATLTLISENAQSLLNGKAATIGLVDWESREISFVSCSGDRVRHLAGQRMSVDEGLLGWVARQGEALLSNDVASDPRYYSTIDHYRGAVTQSVVAAPLQSKGRTTGVIAVIDHQQGTFSRDDLRRLLSLATPAATAIENAHLFTLANEEIAARKLAEAELEQERAALARRVAERTQELSLANKELSHAAQMKDEFLASMSHELRTPLNAILGISESLLEGIQGTVTEQQGRSLSVIESSGRQLLSMIEDILDVAKIGSGELTINPEHLQIAAICNACLQFARREAQQKTITLSMELLETSDTVYADARLLKQALVNLLNNAVKFTPGGGSAGLRVHGDRECVHFTVWDNGIGIAPADVSRLFQPFVQLDGRLERRFGGTGLGLHLVHRIAELHAGKIAVQSTPEKGSHFTLSIPRREKTSHTNALIDEEEAPSAGKPATHLTILLAEDNDANRAIFSDYLNMSGYRVIGTANGVEAVSLCEERPPDLVLMDLHMPGLSGLDAIKQIRRLPGREKLPIVVLTAMSRREDREACLAAGADGFLTKPAPLQEVKATIQRFLGNNGAQNEE